ncbi:peptidylprolyl isomerase [Marinibactrum halimedae]|uniref:Chaperone SurA n=1 Tax=Marinibactrum halimedae TaxID=1444977 RepID=A0AA37T6L3_9GAMM|nr:peptidylprolyl isomerase [Marinibactrum halimedae]MCD9459561.1 peptidylprolyl isomerase [Marinibactrum halimedae]GLS25622.1 chaperone SurA [Marinibactrum halimedae]
MIKAISKTCFHTFNAVPFFKKRVSHSLAAVSAITLITLSPLGLTPPAHSKTVDLDKVVAIVDDDVVMESELKSQMRQVLGQLKQRASLPPEEVLREQVLEHLIVKRLQLAMAYRVGMDISSSEVEQTIARMQQTNGLSADQFTQQLSQDGLTIGGLKQQIREEMLVQRVQQARVNSRIQVSEQEVDNFLSSEEGKFWLSPQYQLGHILIPFSGNGLGQDLANTQVQAQSIYNSLTKGENFRELAVAHSGGQNALQGGDLGWRKGVELPELFSEQLTSMEAGDVSKPFKSGAGIHILKVYDKRGSSETVIRQSKVRHILLKPSEILSEAQAKQQLMDFRQQVLNGGDFGELAKEHSEDIGSMLGGGDLGWSLPGKFVPEFEQTMEATAIGEMSEPFRSQFGWHLLMVDDRRDENMTETVIRNQAVNLLRNRRFSEELEIWLQEIRSQAYVDIKM